MEKHQLIEKFQQITIWKRGGQRAPHKPLLLLNALSNCLNDSPRLIPFIEIESKLKQLLIEFGPERKSYHPEYPFWRLKNDDIWELVNAENVSTRKGNTDPKKTELRKYNVLGGFKEHVFQTLMNDPGLIKYISRNILNDHFPSSMHDDILQSIGLEIDCKNVLKRDPNFRRRILIAYEYQCAVCGLSIRVGDSIVGLEAAHIKWHQAGGPDKEENGIALCSLHHKLFDRGAFTITNNYNIQISEEVNGSGGFNEWLLEFHGKKISEPQNPNYIPNTYYLNWHHNEVFKGASRYIKKNG